MDGLSTAATIGTALDLSGKLLSASRRYYKEAKGAKKEIKSIIDEISNLQEVLKRIEQPGDSITSSQLAKLDHIRKPGGPLHQCDSILGPLVSKLDRPLTSRRAMIWPLKKTDVDETLKEIERLKSTLTLASTTALTVLQIESGSQLSNIADDSERQKNEKLRSDVVAWLSTTKPSSNHNINRRRHQPGTGEWFVHGSDFEHWRTTPNSFIWLHGSAGCGKSILSSTIIDHIQTNQVEKAKSALLYYYFDFNDSMKQKVSNFMSSILADLCTQTSDLPDPVKELYLKCNNGHREPLLSDLLCVFLAVVPLFDDVFVVIDALDECPTKDDERQELLKTIERIHDHSAMNLHLIVTSRRHYDIEAVLGLLTGLVAISIESTMTDDDIKMYIQSEVQVIRKKNTWWHDKLCIAVEENLSKGANGMFRWVYCQLDALKSCLRATAVEDKLKKLPKDLRTTYAQILADIPEDHLEDARLALQWLVFSERPLLLEELVEALRVDPSRIPPVDTDAHLTNPTQILEILPNMITIYSQCYENDLYSNEIRLVRHQYGIAGPEENKLAHLRKYHHGTVHLQEIKLAHFSVKEFLLSGMTEKCEATPLLNSVELNECFMTEACLYYMLFYEESKHKARSEKDLFSFPLLAYACQYWSDHWAFFKKYNQSNKQMEQSLATESILLKLFTLSADQLAWPQVYKTDIKYMNAFTEVKDVPSVTALYLAAYHGLLPVVNLLLNSGQDIEEHGGFLGPPLLAACCTRNLDVARLLLDRGANIDARSASGYGALHILSKDRHVKIVNFLLENGASVDIKDKSNTTPLGFAAMRGECQVINTLLDHEANIDLSGALGYTPLMTAVDDCDDTTVKLLLDRGANIDQIVEHADLASALHICAAYGYMQIATLLLDRGANVDLSKSEGLTPLAMATLRQQPQMAGLFLDRGADVYARDKKGRTVLRMAHRQLKRMEKNGKQWEVKEYDQLILRVEEAEKALQQEYGAFIDQGDSDTEALDTEDDEVEESRNTIYDLRKFLLLKSLSL